MKHSTFNECTACCSLPKSNMLLPGIITTFMMLVLMLFSIIPSYSQGAFVRSTVGHPWDDFALDNFYNLDYMDAVFGAGQWSDLRYETLNLGDLLADHNVIYLEGGDDNADELETFLNANLIDLENWVAAGGHLLINSAPNEGDGMSYGFAGVALNYGVGFNANLIEASNAAHPVFAGIGTSYDGNYGNHGIVCPPGMSGILRTTGTNNDVLVEMNHGNGLALFGCITLPWFGMDDGNWTPQPDLNQLGENIIAYLANGAGGPSAPENDLPCDAIPLEINVAADADLNNATADDGEVSPGPGTDTGNGTCNANDGWCSFEIEVTNSVWYTFIAPECGSVYISAGFLNTPDWQLAIYEVEDCSDYSTFVEVGANDDGGAIFAPALELNNLTPGQEYYIQLDGYQGEEGEDLIVVNEVFSFSIECPADVDIECSDCTDPECTGYPTLNFCGDNGPVPGNLGDLPGQFSFEDNVIPGDCGFVIERTWCLEFVIDAPEFMEGPQKEQVNQFGDDLPSETCCTQIITATDLSGPVLSDFDAEIDVQCLEDVPGAEILASYDECSEMEFPVEIFESHTGFETDTCNVFDAFGPGDDWSIWLPELGASSANFVWDANGGSFDQFLDGTAHLYGTVVNDLDNDEAFLVNFWFENKADWTTWNGMGRWYKDDLGFAQPDLFESWSYYEMVGGFSSMIGIGDFAGDELYFYHAPENFFFGFQVGEAANNKNANYGASGWFSYTGSFDGEQVEGIGDINVDMECGPVNQEDCIHNDEFTYFYRAEDDCGNVTLAQQVITVNDDTPPSFINFPEDDTLECDEDIPTYIPVAEDNCSGEVTLLPMNEVITPGECPQEMTIVRTYAAIDICDNREDRVWTLTIVDSTAPELQNLPEAEITVECDAVPAQADVTATDNCDTDVLVDFDENVEEGLCIGEYTITRYWYAVDDCGNEVDYTQVIHVQDTTAPVFDDYPAYTQIECDQADEVTVTATDNCDGAFISIIDEELLSGGCIGVLMRTYLAVDDCGNEATAVQYITLLDTTPPVLVGVPADEELECDEVSLGEDGNYFDDGGVIGEDNCDHPVEITYSEEVLPGDCPQSFTIIRHWLAVDYCENESEDSQTVFVDDTTNPYFENFPANENLECDADVPEVDYPDAFDNCDPEVEIIDTDMIVPGDCEGEYTIERLFRAFDDCGNEVMQTQYLYFTDNTAPVFTYVPENITVECNTAIPFEDAEATDNCSTAVITHIDGEEIPNQECPQAYSFTRTFYAEDDCGNIATAVQEINVEDSTAPEVVYEVEIDAPCDAVSDEPYLTATDNCGLVTIDFEDTPVSGGCAGRIIRDYVVSDECGNITEAQQIITLIDEVDPEVFNCPENATYECDEEIPFDEPTFEDNCDDDLDIVFNEEDDEDNCLRTITRTWTATDHCDNSTVCVQVITVEDTTPPEVFVQDFEWPCDNPEIPEPIEYDDNCNSVSYTYVDVPTDEGCAGSIERTYTVVDACDNETIATQTITLTDDEAPVFTSVAPDETIQCDQPLPTPDATIEDNCDPNPTWSVNPVITPGECEAEYVMVRTYTAVDACGNESTATQTITVVDTEAPEVDYEVEIDAPCDAALNEAYLTASDNCGGVDIDWDDTPVSGGCAGRIIRDYTITDDCGNVTEAQQIITLIDEVDPFFIDFPADVDVECDAVPSADSAIITYDDNCTEVGLTYDGENRIDGPCTDTYTLERTWTITDNCDNSISATWTINVSDNTDPVFDCDVFDGQDFGAECVYDQYVECDEDLPLPFPLTASDNCDEDVEIVVSDVEFPGECDNEYSIERTYTATDNCGNSVSISHMIYIQDNTDPYFTTVPNDISVECDQPVPATSAEGEDSCGPVTISHNDQEIPGNCPNEYTIMRTFTIVDACDNDATYTQVISIEDNTAPEVEYDLETEAPCDALDIPASLTATDNCGTVTIDWNDTPVSGGCAGRIIRDYVVTDLCGNTTEAQQIITLIDEVDPTVEFCPADANYECDQLWLPGLPEFSDNCDDDLDIDDDLDVQDDGCTQVYTYTWTATDHCGNQAECVQVITVTDSTDPIVNGEDSEADVPCNVEILVIAPGATDNCDDELEMTPGFDLIPGDCPNERTEIYTFTYTDDCNNSATRTYIYHFFDNEAPVFTSVPSNDEVPCDEPLPTEEATAEDNCGSVIITSNDEIIPGECPNSYEVVRTFTATDECDNSSEASVSYFVYDDEIPTFDQATPADVLVECEDDLPAPPTLTASDNCGTAEVAVFVEVLQEDDCGNQVGIVHYTATDLCGLQAFTSYNFQVQDTTDPEFVDAPGDLVLACDQDVPEPAELEATDNCGGIVDVDYDEEIIGDEPAEGSIRDCNLSTPDGPFCDGNDPWSVRLFEMPIAGFEFWVTESGSFVEFEDGTAHLQAIVSAQNGDDAGWIVDVWFEDGKTWDEWYVPGQNNFKDDCGNAEGDLLYLDWMYYIMTAGSATMTGTGDITGSFLSLVHAPSNEYYAYQVGASASNVNLNENWSNGGWFTANGTIVYLQDEIEVVDVSGDFAFTADCCPDYEIVRTWTATDCTGNVSEHVQIISFEESEFPTLLDIPETEAIDASKGDTQGMEVRIFPNPTSYKSNIEFSVSQDERTVIQIIDLAGNTVAVLFNEAATAGQNYRIEFNASNLANGVYFLNIVTDSERLVEKIIIQK